jgi:hypothetical protein
VQLTTAIATFFYNWNCASWYLHQIDDDKLQDLSVALLHLAKLQLLSDYFQATQLLCLAQAEHQIRCHCSIKFTDASKQQRNCKVLLGWVHT